MTVTAVKRLDCSPVMNIINGQLMNRISSESKSRVNDARFASVW